MRNKAKALGNRAKAATPPVVKSPAMRHALLVAASLGFTFCAYLNSFDGPFLVDNDAIILRDARVQSVTSAHIHRILTEQYWPLAVAGLYRTLTTLSFLFNYAVLGNGASPAGYHWFNFILHAVNVGLVYTLGLVIFEQIPAAFLLATIWGIHPVLTESVTNIVGRADMLAALSVLTALLLHRKAVEASGRRKALWLGAIALTVTAGMFSKESAIVVVAVIGLYDFTVGRTGSWRSPLSTFFAPALPTSSLFYVPPPTFSDPADLPVYFVANTFGGGS